MMSIPDPPRYSVVPTTNKGHAVFDTFRQEPVEMMSERSLTKDAALRVAARLNRAYREVMA